MSLINLLIRLQAIILLHRGIPGWVIPTLGPCNVSFNCVTFQSRIKDLLIFVIPVILASQVSCFLIFPIPDITLYLNLCALIYGVHHPYHQAMGKTITQHLLMHTQSIHGFILSNIKLMLSQLSSCFKSLLKHIHRKIKFI